MRPLENTENREQLAPVTEIFSARRRSAARRNSAAGPVGDVREPVGAHEAVGARDWGAWSELPSFLRDEEGDVEQHTSVDVQAQEFSTAALRRRSYAVHELNQLLRDKGVSEAAADDECHRLRSLGLLDDNQLAAELVQRLQRRKGLGRAGVLQELRRRHLAEEAIECALRLLGDSDELERATALAHSKVAAMSRLDDETAQRRLGGALQRRGYDAETARAAVDEALRTRVAPSSSRTGERKPASRVIFRP